MHISWVVLQMWKPPTRWKMLTTSWPWSTRPQASWSLRTNNVYSCDTTLFPHCQPTQKSCTSWSCILWPVPHLPFKNALLKPFIYPVTDPDLQPTFSLYGPAVKLSLLQTPMFWYLASLYLRHMSSLPSCNDSDFSRKVWLPSLHSNFAITCLEFNISH